MKQLLLVGALLSLAMLSIACKPSLVLYAQTVPATVTATWNPNPATDNVVSYKVALDGTVSATLPAASCSATACSQVVSVPTFGNHAISVIADNLKITSDPTSLQDGPPTSLSFQLNQKPGVLTGLTAK